MGSGGKGAPKQNWDMVAGENAYNTAMRGDSWNPGWDTYAGGKHVPAMKQGFAMGQEELNSQEMFWNMFESFQNPPEMEEEKWDSSNQGWWDEGGYIDNSTGMKYGRNDPGWTQEGYDTYGYGDLFGTMAAETQGLNDRDAAYLAYNDAADKATTYVTGQIGDERSNAALLGVDYNITDEQKSTRINDFFATIWDVGDQEKIDQLTTDWGAPDDFTEFLVTRGNADAVTPGPAEETTLATSTTVRPNTLLTDEEGLGGGNSVLG